MQSVPLVPWRDAPRPAAIAAPPAATEANTDAKTETKAVDLSAELWAAVNGGWGLPTKSGAQVSTLSALQVTAYYRGLLSIAEGVAQMPIEIYRSRKDGRGAEPAKDHPLFDVLLHQPNAMQDAFQFVRATLMHAAGTGKGVSYKNIVGGQVRELIPIKPEAVGITLDNTLYEPVYDISFENGDFTTVRKEQVFVISGPMWSVYRALDPSVVGREAIGLAQTIESAHARFHRNASRPSGVLHTEQRLDKPAIDLLRAQWQESFGGTDNVGKVPVAAGGLKWQSIAQTGVESQTIETRKHQIEEIARLLGVFPIMLGHGGDQSPTFASADALFEAHVRYTLQPWMRAVKLAAQTQLLTREERAEGYYIRVDSSELTRGSLKARSEYYRAALGNNSQPGWLRPNEVREDDGWNPVDEETMDQVWQPATMAPAGQRAEESSLPEAKTRREAKSATLRTLYVCRHLLNSDELLRWAREQGFKAPLAAKDLHVTIAYSRKRIDWMAVGEGFQGDSKGELIIKPGGPRVVEPIGSDGAIALKFASSELAWRHMEIREAGASWDHNEYQPHVTITYDGADVDLDKVVPFRGALRFGPELFAEIDESWKEDR